MLRLWLQVFLANSSEPEFAGIDDAKRKFPPSLVFGVRRSDVWELLQNVCVGREPVGGHWFFVTNDAVVNHVVGEHSALGIPGFDGSKLRTSGSVRSLSIAAIASSHM